MGEDSKKENAPEMQNSLDILEGILEEIPQENRQEVSQMIAMSMQMGGTFSPQTELMKKIQPEHISEFLKSQDKLADYSFKENRENKAFLGLVLVAVLGFVIVLIVLLKSNPDIMEKVIYSLVSLVTGLFGGYGLGKSSKEK